MKRILVLVLIAGLLVGAFASIGELLDEHFQDHTNFSDESESTGDELGDPVPCGGGESGGGGGTPG